MRFNNQNLNLKAFTLLEILIVLGLITFISVLAFPSITQLKTASITSKVGDLSSLIYLYQQNAYNGLNNQKYGFRFSQGGYEIFIGDTYSSAISKEMITLDSGISISEISLAGGTTDLIFSKGSLKPNAAGNIKISNSVETYQININSEGFTEYFKI